MLLTAILSLLALASANPVWHHPYDNSMPITNTTYDKLLRAHSFAAAAYCRENVEDFHFEPCPLYCWTAACYDLMHGVVKLVQQFHSLGSSDATGFVAADHKDQKIVVAFRGSASLRNDFADADFSPVWAFDVCRDCMVSEGFYKFWTAAKEEVLGAISMISREHPTYPVQVVGHSLGGAVATIAAPALRNEGYYVDLFTFSSPRVGDDTFAKFASNPINGTNHRVTHLNDWVTKVPPHQFLTHIADEYFITGRNSEHVNVTDIRHFRGYQFLDYVGGNGATTSTDFTFQTHSWIFDNVTECSREPNHILTMRQAFEAWRSVWSSEVKYPKAAYETLLNKTAQASE